MIKKFFLCTLSFVALSLIMASCGDGNDPDNGGNGGNGGNSGKFKINISNVTETSFDVEIVPASTSTYYIFGKMKSSQFLERPKVYAATYITSGNYPDNLVNGKQTESYINLNIATEYAVFACEVGEDYKIVGDVAYVLVKTKGDQPGSEGSLTGKFSVSSTKRVYFSKGNLQYLKTDCTLRFAEQQWDFVGDNEKGNVSYNGEKCNNELYDTRYKGWIDLFGWGTGDQPLKKSTDNVDYAKFNDWGMNKISNGGNEANLWRTLTKKEWEYILSKRANASTLYGSGTVNGVSGMIILPDDWKMPNNVSTPFKAQNSFTANIYSGNDWTNMATNGAVFLPAAGCMEVDQYTKRFITSGVGENGCYWSATPHESDAKSAWFLMCYDGFTTANNVYLRYQRYSVRLVQDVK